MSSRKNRPLLAFLSFILFVFFFYCTYHFYFEMMSYYKGEYLTFQVLKIDDKKVSQSHTNYYAEVSFVYKNNRILDTIQLNQSDIDRKSINKYFHNQFGYAEPDSKLVTIFLFCLVVLLTLIFGLILYFTLKT